MHALPSPIVKYLRSVVSKDRAIAWLVISRRGTLLESGGDLSAHRVQTIKKGDPVAACLPFLHGLLPADSAPLTLPALEVEADRFSDLHVFSSGKRDWVLLLDSTAENLLQRETENALHRSEEQLRQSQKMETLGRLASGVAHDFNNLLTVITGYAQFLLDGFGMEDPRATAAKEIYTAAERCADLSSRLLAFSRRQIVQARVLDLNALIRNMLQMLQRLIGENIRFVTDLDPALWNIKADSGQIEQVIVNLVVNSKDAMPRGGTLRVETSNTRDDTGDHVTLAVTDTGCGIDPEIQAHIFEPFFTTKELHKGTGLGLATVYGIVQECAGIIAVDSQPGRGTSMRIRFPRTEEAAAPSRPVPKPLSARPATERILLVEDEESVRELVCNILARERYTVLKASDAEEALRISIDETGPIHVLVTDVLLPGMTGTELAQRLSEQRPDIRILFMSGYAPESSHLQPASALLHKPFTGEALVQKLGEMLDRPTSPGEPDELEQSANQLTGGRQTACPSL
jgi:two-component system, cell cycle sensor histidine kinase and response regulator CckA